MCRGVLVILLFAFLLISGTSFAAQYAYIVRFTDKNNTAYSLSSPGAYLSARAITRRTTQSIPIDSTDLPVNGNYIDSVLTLTGSILHGKSKWFNYCVVLLSDSTQIHALDGKPYISSTKFIAYYATNLHLKTGTKNPPFVAEYKTTADASYYGNTWQQTSVVNGQQLHTDGHSGAGKLIAVLDAGFIDADTNPGFNSMWADGRMVDKYNFTLANNSIFAYDAHGMRVFSTIAGYVPGTFVGSAPMASYALYVTEDGNSEQPIEMVNMLFASERADSIGADVITTSLGYNGFDNPADNFVFATDFDGKTTIAAQAANMATKKGILFVASAGNEGGNSWNMILTPGDADSALTIGSVDITGAVAPNSGYGPNAAGHVKPDVCGMGQAAAILNGTGFGMQSGTSFSTPQVAGWAACMWQAYPTATPYQIRQAIIKCASSYTSPGNHIGYGIADFQCARQLLVNVVDPPKPFSPANWVVVAPNPFGNDITLYVTPNMEQMVDFSIMDALGRVVAATHKKFYKGTNMPFTMQVPELAAGVYILKASSDTYQAVLKIIKE